MNVHPFAPFMKQAIALAERGRWNVAPNPTVGALLVRDGQIVAGGWHAFFGGPHAEINCLADARAKGVNPADCTLVVTLEPCNHSGKTPPCTQAILEAGIKHIVIGMADPNPIAAGGAQFLASNGIQVETGIEEDACRELIADFLVWQKTGRPYVILKMAATLDGRIATRTGNSQWISNATSRAQVHALRAAVGRAGGAVLVGNNTLLYDNPQLTARDIPVTRQPLAAAIVSRLPANDNLYILKERPSETILFTTSAGAASPRAAAMRQKGIRVVAIVVWNDPDGKGLNQALCWLRSEAGCNYVLCEGGATLGRSLLDSGLVDEFSLYLSPKVLGDNEARPLFDGRSPQLMDDAIKLRTISCELVDGDCHLILRPVR